uniref:NADH-ubiquinone oxidoreductase chain 2 n=1 Tax=Carios capensis TaxID=176285 RepID=Q76LS5_CARC1|nr:NADH dehydrogenase subunit 2 [Alectorobius capensis]BAD03970.1 NADH dehydrogenase 2 [Alectorobius capensis]
MMPYFIFIWFILTSIILSFSTSSFFFLWVCLEINMMSFIPLMYTKTMISTNSIMMYFLVQSFASSIFILIISIQMINPIFCYYFKLFMAISMMMKLGAAPFHIWFPQISEGLPYSAFLILLTLQKMIPLYILSIFKNQLMILTIILNSMIGSLGGFNQFSVRKILAFSSIAHLAWILALQFSESNFWFIYMLLYSLIIFFLISMVSLYNINSLNFNKKISLDSNILLITILLTLGGMPPTLGFIMKWMSLKIIVNIIPIITFPLIVSSLLNLFLYLRLIYAPMLKYLNFYKWEKNFLTKMMTIISPQIGLIFLMISLT